MQLVVLLVLISLPLLEIGLLIKIGQWLGLWWTLAVIVATFFLGLAVLMREGVAGPMKVQAAMREGRVPVGAMLDGLLLGLAGVLLITPGFLADSIGLLLLIPPLRRLIGYLIAKRMVIFGEASYRAETVDRDAGGRSNAEPSGRPRPGADDGGPVIDGEFERLGERPINRDPRR